MSFSLLTHVDDNEIGIYMPKIEWFFSSRTCIDYI